jgi:hypothetical protein
LRSLTLVATACRTERERERERGRGRGRGRGRARKIPPISVSGIPEQSACDGQWYAGLGSATSVTAAGFGTDAGVHSSSGSHSVPACATTRPAAPAVPWVCVYVCARARACVLSPCASIAWWRSRSGWTIEQCISPTGRHRPPALDAGGVRNSGATKNPSAHAMHSTDNAITRQGNRPMTMYKAVCRVRVRKKVMKYSKYCFCTKNDVRRRNTASSLRSRERQRTAYFAPVRTRYAFFGTRISVERMAKFRDWWQNSGNGARNSGFTRALH